MVLDVVNQFATNLGGRKVERLDFWNPSDDNPKLAHARWEIDTPDGIVKVFAYEQRPGTVWPDYPCSGDSLRNKFAAHLTNGPGSTPRSKITYLTDGFVDATPANLQGCLGQFQGRNE